MDLISYCFIFIFTIMVYIVNFKIFQKQKSRIIRFTDNHKYININIETSAWDDIQSEHRNDCSSKTLIKCEVNKDFQCFNCTQVLASCVHFENDTPIYTNDTTKQDIVAVIPKNTLPNEGYCLRFTDTRGRECSEKFGGKWALTKQENSYAYVCVCSMQNIFTKSTIYGNCDTFLGCHRIGPSSHAPPASISNPDTWQLVKDIQCECGDDYQFIAATESDGALRPPYCLERNSFQQALTTFVALPKEYINEEYLEGKASRSEIQLPDPCAYDALTGEQTGKRAKFSDVEKVAYCQSTRDGFAAITFNSDYLIGNNGKYPNGIVRVSKQSALEGELFEVATRRNGGQRNTVYPPFVGHRYWVRDFLFHLPYLDKDSRNMGGSGAQFNFAAFIPKENIGTAKIWVYSPELPRSIAEKKYKVGSMVTYIPTFSYTFEIRHVYFLGTVPFIDVPAFGNSFTQYIITLHLPTFKWPQFSSDGLMYVWTPNLCGEEFLNYYAMPTIVRDANGQSKLSWRSRVFTGTILTQGDNGRTISKFISPGSVVLRNRYLSQIPNLPADECDRPTPWSSLPQCKQEDGSLKDICPERSNVNSPFRVADTPLYAGENSYGYDCDEVSMPRKYTTLYRCSTDDFAWAKNY